jgi:Glutaredoxin and related proteins
MSDQVAAPPHPAGSTARKASLYRMVMPAHVCPYGMKSKDLLEREGFAVDDHWLTSREETDAFKREHGVDTTPQTFIDGRRVGGWDALRRHFGHHVAAPGETSYRPVVAIFATALAMAAAVTWLAGADLLPLDLAERFVAMAMCLLAIQKLVDVESFSTMFLNYDLLARRWVRYAYLYPFAEFLAGVLMLAGAALWLAAPLALVIGTIGAVSVFRAVYVEKRELKCACVGGASSVPLGFVSLTENLMMIGMAIWMPTRAWLAI